MCVSELNRVGLDHVLPFIGGEWGPAMVKCRSGAASEGDGGVSKETAAGFEAPERFLFRLGPGGGRREQPRERFMPPHIESYLASQSAWRSSGIGASRGDRGAMLETKMDESTCHMAEYWSGGTWGSLGSCS
jgi:hypothetical protein